MELIRLTKENLAREHICCAISNEKDPQVSSKKAWLSDRLDDGLVFLKGDVRGKCFIEYLPAEKAWAPIRAEGYMYIDCLWVSGQFKGHGYSNLLLDECIWDSRAKGKKGLVILSSPKKLGFLADPKYLRHKGFEAVDSAPPYFELLALPFDAEAEQPSFRPQVKETRHPEMPAGFTLYYTSQCPFTAKYVPLLEQAAKARNAPLQATHIETAEQAQRAPSPFTTFALYCNGAFLTHEIQSEKKFEKLMDELGI